VTMGNVVYQFSPYQQEVTFGGNSAGIESFINLNVTRTEYSPGDFNHDGAVTASDYGMWKESFGQMGMGLPTDSNCDGTVDAADYVTWRDHFAIAGAGGVAMTAPEPTTIALNAVVVFGMLPVIRVRKGTICSRR
jgi:hypothetical protein